MGCFNFRRNNLSPFIGGNLGQVQLTPFRVFWDRLNLLLAKLILGTIYLSYLLKGEILGQVNKNEKKEKEREMKLISWNVNGIRACRNKGFDEFFKQIQADVFCIQETKCQPEQVNIEFEGYKSYWNSAEKKGYSGTAVFTKKEPISVTYGIGIEEHDHEGRIITLEFEDFYLVIHQIPKEN